MGAQNETLKSQPATEERVFRTSVKPEFGKADAKVHPHKDHPSFKVRSKAEAEAPARPAAAPQNKKMTLHPSGIECWGVDDLITADQLVATSQPDDMAAAIAAAVAAGKRPVPGTVSNFMRARENTKAAALAEAVFVAQKAAQDALHKPPPLTQEAFNKLPLAAQRLAARRVQIIQKIENQGATP